MDAATRLAPYLRVSVDQVLPQFKGITLPNLAENHAQLGGNSPQLSKLATSLRDLMLKRKLLRQSFELEHRNSTGKSSDPADLSHGGAGDRSHRSQRNRI